MENYFDNQSPVHDKEVEEEFEKTYKEYKKIAKKAEKKLKMNEE